MLIELTDFSNGNTLSVNPDHIVYVESNGNGERANVYTTAHGLLRVKETREQVHALANGTPLPVQPEVGVETPPVTPEEQPVDENATLQLSDVQPDEKPGKGKRG